MPKVKFVKSANKDNPVCKKGESYFWWKFRYGGKRYSLTCPKASQLTQSEFLGWAYDMQERSFDITVDGAEDTVTELINDIEEQRDELQEKLDNMPEHLQDTSSSGELLTERIGTLDNAIDTLHSIDYTYDKEKDDEEDSWIDGIISEVQSAVDSLTNAG